MKNKAGFCPLRRDKCMPACMWRTDGACAIALIAGQARRQADELYALTEVILRGADAIAPDSAEALDDEQ